MPNDASEWLKKELDQATTEHDAFYNANYVVAEYDLADFIRRCGYELTRGEMFCPLGHDKDTKSFKVDKKMPYLFKCFGAGCKWNKSGNIITFARFVNGSENYKQAVELIRGHKPLSKIVKRVSIPKAPKKTSYKLDYNKHADLLEAYEENLTKQSPVYKYLLKRGLSGQTINTFRLGSEINKTNKAFIHNLAIPIFDLKGRVLGFKYRNLKGGNDRAFWTSQGLPKSDFLYSLEVLPHVKKAKAVYLLEGEIDAMSLYEIGIKNVLAFMGGGFNDIQYALIKPYVKDIIVIADNDPKQQGKIMANKVVKRFNKAGECNVRILDIDYAEHKDANDLLIAGRLKEVIQSAKLVDRLKVSRKAMQQAEAEAGELDDMSKGILDGSIRF